jgi:CRISPR-associated exonuclease Cas4
MFTESDLLPLSALQHLMFCERQCALIHIEGLWAENVLTVEGRHLHEKVDSGAAVESRGDLRIARGLALRSFRLGLSGRADVVEFHRQRGSRETARADTEAQQRAGIRLRPDFDGQAPARPSEESRAEKQRADTEVRPYEEGLGEDEVWRPYPVEYKRGKPKRDGSDEVQLCAQALCLEEMLAVEIPEGALFYGKTRRRKVVTLTPELRSRTEEAARRLHELIRSGVTPKAYREPKCERCSLLKLCLPPESPRRSAGRYLASAFDPKD